MSELSHFCDGCFAGLDGDDEGIECDADDVAIAGYHVADYTVERNNEARTKTTGDRAACITLLVKRAHELLSKRRGGAQLVLPWASCRPPRPPSSATSGSSGSTPPCSSPSSGWTSRSRPPARTAHRPSSTCSPRAETRQLAERALEIFPPPPRGLTRTVDLHLSSKRLRSRAASLAFWECAPRPLVRCQQYLLTRKSSE